jgi:hypothetical protein
MLRVDRIDLGEEVSYLAHSRSNGQPEARRQAWTSTNATLSTYTFKTGVDIVSGQVLAPIYDLMASPCPPPADLLRYRDQPTLGAENADVKQEIRYAHMYWAASPARLVALKC